MPTTAYFKLQILSIFVHEVAHHFDHTRRIARGRWLASEQEKVEHFADHRQHEWTQTCVVPYIERALEELLKDVLQETHRIETLFSFAVNLKIADLFERAQQVIDCILVRMPDHEDALELRANIWNFQESYAEAALLASRIIEHNPRNWRARTTLTRAYEGLEQWAQVIETATESLTLFDEELDLIDAISSRCSAYWKLGKRTESDEDLRTLQNFPRASVRVKWILRKRDRTK